MCLMIQSACTWRSRSRMVWSVATRSALLCLVKPAYSEGVGESMGLDEQSNIYRAKRTSFCTLYVFAFTCMAA